jgi:hypothetical protein
VLFGQIRLRNTQEKGDDTTISSIIGNIKPITISHLTSRISGRRLERPISILSRRRFLQSGETGGGTFVIKA